MIGSVFSMRCPHLRTHMLTRLLSLFLLCIPLFGGQSVSMSNRGESYFTDPAMDGSNPVMIEFQIHSWTLPGGFREFLTLSGSGLRIALTSTSLWLSHTKVTDTTGATPFTVSLADRTNVLVRYRRDFANSTATIEVWNVDGSGYVLQTYTLTGTANAAAEGGTLNTVGAAVSLGFLRVSSTLVPAGSRPPTTVGTANIHNYKFDGNTKDATGVGNWGGSFDFETTPNQDVVVSIPKVSNTPAWAPFRPIRAGHADTLDGSQSYTMADDSATASCLWVQLSGPTTLQFSSKTSCTPTVTGAVFGPYSVRLVAGSSAGGKDVKDLEFGAVAYDDNGVVIYPDERLSKLLGPTKVYTQGDWEYAERQLTSMAQANWGNYSLNGGSWDLEVVQDSIDGVQRLGAVTLTKGSTTVTGSGTQFLNVFCGGRVGPAIQGPLGNAQISVRTTPGLNTSWRGARWEATVNSCVSDTELTITSGWDFPTTTFAQGDWSTWGLMDFRRSDATGTVYTSAGQPTKIFGTGTNFLAKFCDGQVGTPSRVNFMIVIENGLVSRKLVGSCQSDTEVTIYGGGTWTTTHISSPGVAWGYESRAWSGEWRQSQNNANYYDVALGHYTLYYRSGWSEARDAARWLAERWWQTPGYSGFPRAMAASSIYVLMAVDTEYTSSLTDRDDFWPRMRWIHEADPFGANRCTKPNGIGIEDIREHAYCLYYQALHAQLDPDETERNTIKDYLVSQLSLYQGRQRANGAFWDGYASGNTDPVVTVSNGSATVTKHSGTNFGADFCGVVSSFYETGLISGVKGSTTLTGSGTNFVGQANGKAILIRGTLDGQPFSQINYIASVTNATTIVMRYPWSGDTGTALDYRIQNAGTLDYFVFSEVSASNIQTYPGQTEDDNWYWCTVDSGTQITLDKPYTGDSSSGNIYRRIMKNSGGGGTTAFMQGLLAMALLEVADVLRGYDESASASYLLIGRGILNFLYDWQPLPYGKLVTPYLQTDLLFCHPREVIPNICDGGESVSQMRSYSVESMRAFAKMYLLTEDSADLTRADAWMTSLFSVQGTSAPYVGDGDQANLVREGDYRFSPALTTKNYGQTWGIGGGQTWPGARFGKTAPRLPESILVAPRIDDIPNATKLRVRIKSPSGAESQVQCNDLAACSILIDARQGAHWVVMEYLSSEDALLSASEPELVFPK